MDEMSDLELFSLERSGGAGLGEVDYNKLKIARV